MAKKEPGACAKIFITGIPTAGKSYLARRLVRETGGICLETDNLWETLAQDSRYRPGASFFLSADRSVSFADRDYETQWQILVRHHEQVWPGILDKIRDYELGRIPLKSKIAARLRKLFDAQRPLIFEGASLLPHLARRDLPFPGIVLIGRSFQDVLDRNREKPRWGASEKLQRLSAHSFWHVHRPHYIAEAERCGYPIFENADDAYAEALRLLGRT